MPAHVLCAVTATLLLYERCFYIVDFFNLIKNGNMLIVYFFVNMIVSEKPFFIFCFADKLFKKVGQSILLVACNLTLNSICSAMRNYIINAIIYAIKIMDCILNFFI